MKVLPFAMFLFQFVKQIIETVIEIYKILLIWWVDPQYPWSKGIGSPIWGSSMTRVKMEILCVLVPWTKVASALGGLSYGVFKLEL